MGIWIHYTRHTNVNVPHYNLEDYNLGTSNVVTLMGRLTPDFFLQNRYLLDNTDLTIKISRSKNSFCYIGNGDFKLKILGATLFVRKVQINPEVRLAHAHCLEYGTAKYPLVRVDMKPISIPRNTRNFFKENLCSGALLSRIVFGLVDSEAFNALNTKNPFNFQHFNLTSVQFQVESVDIPYKPFETDFSTENFTEAYFSHFLGVNKNISDVGSIVTRDDFAKGYALYAFDSHFNLIKSGNLRMVVNFSADTSVNIVFVYIVCVVYNVNNTDNINKVNFTWNIKT